ncbi:MAG: hypothetical protein LBU23_04795, partial [Planctomycetota bacterium]|nr:hypothetical protein [Planctomycetota bacterium]
MKKRLLELIAANTKIQLFFHGSAGNKLVSVNGVLVEADDDHLVLSDLYSNTLLIPMNSIAYIEVK